MRRTHPWGKPAGRVRRARRDAVLAAGRAARQAGVAAAGDAGAGEGRGSATARRGVARLYRTVWRTCPGVDKYCESGTSLSVVAAVLGFF